MVQDRLEELGQDLKKDNGAARCELNVPWDLAVNVEWLMVDDG